MDLDKSPARGARWRRGNALGSDGATAIAGGLRHVPSLTHLCLRCEAARARSAQTAGR